MDFFAYFAFIIIFLPLHNGFIDLCEEGSYPTLWLCRPYRDEMYFFWGKMMVKMRFWGGFLREFAQFAL